MNVEDSHSDHQYNKTYPGKSSPGTPTSKSDIFPESRLPDASAVIVTLPSISAFKPTPDNACQLFLFRGTCTGRQELKEIAPTNNYREAVHIGGQNRPTRRDTDGGHRVRLGIDVDLHADIYRRAGDALIHEVKGLVEVKRWEGSALVHIEVVEGGDIYRE